MASRFAGISTGGWRLIVDTWCCKARFVAADLEPVRGKFGWPGKSGENGVERNLEGLRKEREMGLKKKVGHGPCGAWVLGDEISF